jgi:CRP/FNR family transcriptional regulator, cyclic AMP receptor protein
MVSAPAPERVAMLSDLTRLELFADVDADAVARLTADLDAVSIAPGNEIDIADTSAACCVVTTGRLALFFEAEADRPRTVSLVEEGDVLVRPTTAVALGPHLRCRAIEPSSVLLVPRDRLDEWMQNCALARNLVRVLSAQVGDRELAVAIALEPRVERRLLLKIRQLADRWGRVTPRGVRLDLRLTHQELADMVGAVRESVTVSLRSLAKQRILTVRDRTILIRNDETSGSGRPTDDPFDD